MKSYRSRATVFWTATNAVYNHAWRALFLLAVVTASACSEGSARDMGEYCNPQSATCDDSTVNCGMRCDPRTDTWCSDHSCFEAYTCQCQATNADRTMGVWDCHAGVPLCGDMAIARDFAAAVDQVNPTDTAMGDGGALLDGAEVADMAVASDLAEGRDLAPRNDFAQSPLPEAFAGVFHMAVNGMPAGETNLQLYDGGTFRWVADGCDSCAAGQGLWRVSQGGVELLPPPGQAEINWPTGKFPLVNLIPGPGMDQFGDDTQIFKHVWVRGRVCVKCSGFGPISVAACNGPYPAGPDGGPPCTLP